MYQFYLNLKNKNDFFPLSYLNHFFNKVLRLISSFRQLKCLLYLFMILCILPSFTIAQQNTGPIECPNKDGLIRYAFYPNHFEQQGLRLYFYNGAQYVQGSFKDDTYLDIQTDGELRIKGIVQLPNQDKSLDEWIIDMRFSYQVNINKYTVRSFKLNKGAKLVNKSNRHEVMVIRPLKQPIEGIYDLNLSYDPGQDQDVQAKADFEYQRSDGSWRQAKITVFLKPLCKQINPLKVKQLDSDRENTYKWRLVNSNQREVKITLRDYQGRIQPITVPTLRKGGVYEFYTDKRNGAYLHLRYAALPDFQINSEYVNQNIQGVDAESALPEE